jgi:ATP-dependent RNA helicase DDX49/DBP8
MSPAATSSSASEASSASNSSSVASEPEGDFPEESPRKRRKISPPVNTLKEHGIRASEPSLSRIKSKKPVLSLKNVGNFKDSVGKSEENRGKSTFANLNVHPWLVASLSNMAITRPTGIQKGCIPEILKGRDCIGGSKTGSGKTVAFAVPILQKWAEDPVGIFAVVLTPTRCVFCILSL